MIEESAGVKNAIVDCGTSHVKLLEKGVYSKLVVVLRNDIDIRSKQLLQLSTKGRRCARGLLELLRRLM